jgi:regulator of protease activity HflC (stomatin/prohibitin superfamily)
MPNIDELLNFLSIGAWIVFAIYAVAVFVRSWLEEGLRLALLRLGSARVLVPLLIAICITLISASIVFVDPTRVAVVISTISPGGIRPDPLPPGLHLIVPVLEKEEKYLVAWQTYTMSSSPAEGQRQGDDSIRARTNDGQEVFINSSTVFRVNPERAVTLYIDWQSRFIEDFVRPEIRGVVRGQVSQYTANEVNSSARVDLEASLERILRARFSEQGLLVNQFLLRDITFSDEYATAVEEKQVAMEAQERARHEAEQIRNLAEGERDRIVIEASGRSQQYQTEAEGRAKAIVIEAQAQSEALTLISQALSGNPELLTYQYIDKLSPNIRVMLVPNNAPLMLPLPDLGQTVAATETLANSVAITSTATFTSPVALDLSDDRSNR